MLPITEAKRPACLDNVFDKVIVSDSVLKDALGLWFKIYRLFGVFKKHTGN